MSEIEVPTEAAVEAPVAESPEPESSTGIDYSTQSDDDIIDGAIGDGNTEEPVAKVESKDSTDAKPVVDAKATPVTKEEKPQEEQVEDVEPESLQKLYADPALKADLQKLFEKNPEVRKAWFRAGQIADMFPTVAEAKEVRALFPSLQTAQHASQSAAVLARMDQTYAQNPKEFAERLATGNPNAFAALVENSREVLFKSNPDAYRRSIGEPVAADALANAEDWANANGDEPFIVALQILRDRIGISAQPGAPQGKAAPAPQDPRLAEYEQLKADANRMRGEATQAFESSVHQGFWDGLRSAVDQVIGKPEAMSDKAVLKVKSEVFQAVAEQIATQRNLQPIYENYIRSGDMSEATRQNAVNFLMGYAKQVLGPVARARLSEWTKEILQANQAEVQKATAQPKKRDVGSGSGQARASKPGNGKIDYRKLSDDDIIEGRF
jgi:hypothetical protein